MCLTNVHIPILIRTLHAITYLNEELSMDRKVQYVFGKTVNKNV